MLPILLAAATCVPQPLEETVEAAALPGDGHAITFTAKPSLQLPQRAWVVRLTGGAAPYGWIEVVQAREQARCRRYVVEKRWRAPLNREGYARVAARIAALAFPNPAALMPPPVPVYHPRGTDGTGIELRLRANNWELHQSSDHRRGQGASAFFRCLIDRYVPAAERPTGDWRTPTNPLRDEPPPRCVSRPVSGAGTMRPAAP